MQETGGKKPTPVMQQEQRKKKVQEGGNATFHFVHSVMMKYLITESVEREEKSKTQAETRKGGRNV